MADVVYFTSLGLDDIWSLSPKERNLLITTINKRKGEEAGSNMPEML